MKLKIKKDYVLNHHDFSAQEVFLIVEEYGCQDLELHRSGNYHDAIEAFEKISEFYKNKPKKITIHELSI